MKQTYVTEKGRIITEALQAQGYFICANKRCGKPVSITYRWKRKDYCEVCYYRRRNRYENKD